MQRKSGVAICLVCGVAAGAVPAKASSYQVVYNFDHKSGESPMASLIAVGPKLYGTTMSGGKFLKGKGPGGLGTVFWLKPTLGTEKAIYSFEWSPDGNGPSGGLIDFGGTLYGTAVNGGANNGGGTVFSVNPKTGVETVLHSFGGSGDGSGSTASLINVGGTLYGTTYLGGSTACGFGCGTVFSVDPTTGAESVLHEFQGTDGNYPRSRLLDAGGTLYGTTSTGGTFGYGTVFSVNPTTGTTTVLYAFQGGSDGAYSQAGLIDVGGTLYGTTGNGGPASAGTVFSVDPSTGSETVVYAFHGGSDGAGPDGEVLNVGGTLYGTTRQGGGSGCNGPGCGTIFSVDPTTGAETVLYSFQGSPDGANPEAGLLNVSGTLYGTTQSGGAPNSNCGIPGCGTVFAFTP